MSTLKVPNPRKLTLEERRKIGVPGGGEWFNKKNIAKEFASMHYGTGGGFVLGFDLPMRGYCYGVYASYDESITYLLQLKSDCRHGYEMIRSENECNLYLDLELICKEEDETEIMERTVESIRATLRLKYKTEFRLQVTRGSRVTEKGFKHTHTLLARPHVAQATKTSLTEEVRVRG